MNYNSAIIVFALSFLLILSGIDQRLLYLLFPSFGLLALSNDRFKIDQSLEIKLSFLAISLLFLIFLVQSIFYFLGFFTFQGFMRYLSYFFLLLFIRRLNTSTLNFFLYTFTLLLLASIPAGIYISIIQNSRFQFIFNHSNHLAYVCILLSFYFLKIYTGSKFKGKLIILLLGFLVLLTKSTGGLLTYSLLILYSLYDSSNSGLFKKLTLIIPSVIVLALLMSFSERFMDQLSFLKYYNLSFILERAQSHQAGGVGSGLWRIIHWLSILYNFFGEENIKILFGTGIDTMTQGHYQYSFMVTDPHNDFVRILVETGVFGFIIFLVFYSNLIYWVPMSKYLLIVTAMPMMFGNIIVNFPYTIVFTIILVLILKDKNEKNSSGDSVKRRSK